MINISIDLNKIDKSKIKKHTNGANYYSLTVDTLKETDKFGNTHCVYESQTKEEREAKTKRNYIGNGKEFKFGNTNQQQAQSSQPLPPQNNFSVNPETIDDLPF